MSAPVEVDPETTEPVHQKSGYWTYWLTRNRVSGELAPKMDIWLAKPTRILVEDGSGDVRWFAHYGEDESKSAWYGEWTPGEALIHVYNGIPNNDRECIKVGADTVVPAVEVS